MRNIIGLSVGVFLSAAGVAAADNDNSSIDRSSLIEGFAACNGQGELSPSGELRPGQSLWIGNGDAKGAKERGVSPFCTDGDWVERHGYEDDNQMFCVVGEGGLNMGHSAYSSFNEEPVDPDTGYPPNTKSDEVCRDGDGICIPCSQLAM